MTGISIQTDEAKVLDSFLHGRSSKLKFRDAGRGQMRALRRNYLSNQSQTVVSWPRPPLKQTNRNYYLILQGRKGKLKSPDIGRGLKRALRRNFLCNQSQTMMQSGKTRGLTKNYLLNKKETIWLCDRDLHTNRRSGINRWFSSTKRSKMKFPAETQRAVSREYLWKRIVVDRKQEKGWVSSSIDSSETEIQWQREMDEKWRRIVELLARIEGGRGYGGRRCNAAFSGVSLSRSPHVQPQVPKSTSSNPDHHFQVMWQFQVM